jgi:hypothetical protein
MTDKKQTDEKTSEKGETKTLAEALEEKKQEVAENGWADLTDLLNFLG